MSSRMNQMMMIPPVNSNIQETQNIADKNRNQGKQIRQCRTMGHFNFKYHNRDNDGQYSVTKCFNSVLSHRNNSFWLHPFSFWKNVQMLNITAAKISWQQQRTILIVITGIWKTYFSTQNTIKLHFLSPELLQEIVNSKIFSKLEGKSRHLKFLYETGPKNYIH